MSPRLRRRLFIQCLDDRIVPDSTPHSLATSDFSQNWSDTSLISANDNWNNVPSIVGYKGVSSATGANPQTILGESTVVNVNANQTNPNSFANGGVTEWELANPTIGMAGSNSV